MLRMTYLMIIPALALIGASCGTSKEVIEAHGVPHPHSYPFTAVIRDYHVRLTVDHAAGSMTLIFENISEEPVKPVRLQKIVGKVVLPDGRVLKETFRADYRTRRAQFKEHPVGTFTAWAEWIKSTPKFKLNVAIPFRGEDYEVIFNYEVPEGDLLSRGRQREK